MSNPIKTALNWLTESIFGTDPLNLIAREQDSIRRVNARAAEKTSFSAVLIEDAVDFEIDGIRASIRAGFSRIEPLIATGAVASKATAALNTARQEIEKALTKLDAAI